MRPRLVQVDNTKAAQFALKSNAPEKTSPKDHKSKINVRTVDIDQIKPIDRDQYPLIAQLLSDALYDSNIDIENSGKPTKDLKKDIAPRMVLESMQKIINDEVPLKDEMRNLSLRLKEFDVNLEALLEKLFNETPQDNKKLRFTIGKARLLAGSKFTKKYILPSFLDRNENRDFSMEFLNSLTDEEIEWFINDFDRIELDSLKLCPGDRHNILVQALFKIKSKRYFYERLLEKAKKIAPGALSNQHNTESLLENIEKVMIEILRRLPKKDLYFEDFRELYPIVYETCLKDELAELAVRRFKDRKDEICAVFLDAAHSKEVDDEHDATYNSLWARFSALRHYAKLLKENSVDELINIIQTNDETPGVYATACICLADIKICGEDGKERLIKEIARRSFEDESLLPLAYLATVATYERYLPIFIEILSRISNLAGGLSKLEGVKVSQFNPDEDTLEASILDEKFSLVSIVEQIRINNFLIWMSCEETLAENAKGILEAALELDENRTIQKDLSNLLTNDFIPELTTKRIEIVKRLTRESNITMT